MEARRESTSMPEQSYTTQKSCPALPTLLQAGCSERETTAPDLGSVFECNERPVESLTVSKYHVCVRSIDAEGRAQMKVYDRAGSLLHNVVEMTGAELKELCMNELVSKYSESLQFDELENRLASLLLLHGSCNASLQEAKSFYDIFGLHCVPISDFDSCALFSPDMRIPPATDFASDISGRYIRFQTPHGTTGEFDTWDESGGPRHPSEWTVKEWSTEGGRPYFERHVYQTSGPDAFYLPTSLDQDPSILLMRSEDTLTLTDVSSAGRATTIFKDWYRCMVVDPANPSKIIYCRDKFPAISEIEILSNNQLNQQASAYHVPLGGSISALALDPTGLTLACTVESEGALNSTLILFNRSTMRITGLREGIWGPLAIDTTGTVLGLDKSGLLCTTTTSDLQRGRYVQVANSHASEQAFTPVCRALPLENLRRPSTLSSESSVSTDNPLEILSSEAIKVQRAQDAARGILSQFHREFVITAREGSFADLDNLRHRFNAFYESLQKSENSSVLDAPIIKSVLRLASSSCSKAHDVLTEKTCQQIKTLYVTISGEISSARTHLQVCDALRSPAFIDLCEIRDSGAATATCDACIEDLAERAHERLNEIKETRGFDILALLTRAYQLVLGR